MEVFVSAINAGPQRSSDPAAMIPPAMTYVAFARKYRPRTFEDLVGQEPVEETGIGPVGTVDEGRGNAIALGRGLGRLGAADPGRAAIGVLLLCLTLNVIARDKASPAVDVATRLGVPVVRLAAGARVVATGRSDFPNQVNNSVVFPAVFRGVLDVRAKTITDEMCLAAAQRAGRLKTELKKYMKPALLILDELGYLPIDKAGADLLFRLKAMHPAPADHGRRGTHLP